MDAPKKWWWVARVAVPIIVALIAAGALFLSSGGGEVESTVINLGDTTINQGDFTFNQGDVTFNTVNYIVQQIEQTSGQDLAEDVLAMLRDAMTAVQDEDFGKAIPLLETLAETTSAPTILNNLGAAYYTIGDHELAQVTLETAQDSQRNTPEQSASIRHNLEQILRSSLSVVESVTDSGPRDILPETSVAIVATTTVGTLTNDNFEWVIISKTTEEFLVVEGESEITVNLVPGNYEVLVTSDSYEGEATIEVRSAGENQYAIVLTARAAGFGFFSAATIPAGSLMSFDWSGPNAQDDLIFVSAPGMAENRYIYDSAVSYRADQAPPAVLVAPAVPGDYEVRYFSRVNGSVVFRKPLIVSEPEVRWNAPNQVSAATEFLFEFEGPNAPGDLLFVASPNMEPNRYIIDSDLSHRADEGSTALLIAPVQAGSFELRYFSRGNGQVLARFPIQVTGDNVRIEAPRTISPGVEFEIEWEGPNAEGDFLFITEPGLEANRYYTGVRQHRTREGSPAILTAPADRGTYELRYYSAKNGQMVARRVLLVR